MAETPEDPADPEVPISPSVFLDLPPTPGDGEDDMVLPFIRRMLMEEDADDDSILYYQNHPEHPALLQAEQPFAQILSGSSVSGGSTTTNATFSDGADASASTFFNGGGAIPAGDDGATMEMVNVAFLKGMEEASKLLPTSEERERLPLFERSGDADGKKNWHSCRDDVLEAETEGGRRSKLMASSSEPDETDEVADGVFLEGYEVAQEKMEGLGISSSVPGEDEEEEEDNKSDAHAQRQRRQRSSGNEAVDLRTLLVNCAEAVSTGNRLTATELLRQIKRRSSPTGDSSQRLAHCFAQGLELRLAGQQAHMPPMAGEGFLLKAYIHYLRVCPFKMTAFKFSNMAITKAAFAGRRKKKTVHIVDYGVHHGLQWPLLLDAWAKQEGGPPAVRITGIDFPRPGFRPAAWIDDTGRRLTDFARQRGVPFQFRSVVAANWETVSADDLDLDPDEVLVVNGLFLFGKLMDEGGADIDDNSPSPRDRVLANIRRMRPDVFVLCVENSSQSTPFFATRFREALFYYSAMFDMMDATAPRDSAERAVVEQELFGRRALNAIACEGPDRVERPEAYKQWQVRCSRAGLRQLPLDPDKVRYLSRRVKEGYHRDFVVDVDRQWALQGWKGRILCAMSTWAVHDNNNACCLKAILM